MCKIKKNIDYFCVNGTQMIPAECKGGGNVASASFRRYRRENNPDVAIRFSTLPYKKQENVVNVPLYMAGRVKGVLGQKNTKF